MQLMREVTDKYSYQLSVQVEDFTYSKGWQTEV